MGLRVLGGSGSGFRICKFRVESFWGAYRGSIRLSVSLSLSLCLSVSLSLCLSVSLSLCLSVSLSLCLSVSLSLSLCASCFCHLPILEAESRISWVSDSFLWRFWHSTRCLRR